MDNCEVCFTHLIDDSKKIVFQGMTFCDIDCFLSSKHVDLDAIEEVQDAKSETNLLQERFEEVEDEKATALAMNKALFDGIEGLCVLHDDKFGEGNEDLNEVLLALTNLKDENCAK